MHVKKESQKQAKKQGENVKMLFSTQERKKYYTMRA